MPTETKGRACGDKEQHKTKAAAVAHIYHLVRTRGALASRYVAYDCKFCPYFHVGHKRRKTRRR